MVEATDEKKMQLIEKLAIEIKRIDREKEAILPKVEEANLIASQLKREIRFETRIVST